jgi:hypothetical protein
MIQVIQYLKTLASLFVQWMCRFLSLHVCVLKCFNKIVVYGLNVQSKIYEDICCISFFALTSESE